MAPVDAVSELHSGGKEPVLTQVVIQTWIGVAVFARSYTLRYERRFIVEQVVDTCTYGEPFSSLPVS